MQPAIDLAAYNAAVAQANAVVAADYTTASYTALQTALTNNVVTVANTQAEVDTATANINAAYNALVLIPKVTSVSALNAKQIQITFNKAVDANTVLTGGVNDAAITANVSAVVVGTAQAPGTMTGSLDSTKTVLTITAQATAANYFKGQYVVGITPAVKDIAGNVFVAYSSVLTVADTTRPTISGPTYVLNNKATFTFSEPMTQTATQIAAAMTVTKVEDATSVAVIAANIAIATDQKSFTYDMSLLTADKAYTVSFLGLADAAGNLQSPNPSTFTATKTVVDTTAPTITSLTVVNDRNFVIQFSKALSVGPTVTSSAGANTCVATVDATDATKYNVEVTAGFVTGVQTISVAGTYKDLNGNTGAAWSKLVDLKADTTAPVYVSQELKTIGADLYLLVKYNENVTSTLAANALTGTYVDASSITHTMPVIAGTDATDYLIAPATKTDTIKIKITSLPTGTYTATMPNTLVKDLATTPNVAAAKTVTFTVGSITDPTVPVPTVTNVQLADINKVAISFSSDVTAETALNVANYAVEGVNVFDSAIFNGNAKSVVLTLKPNAFTVDGLRVLTIANVTSTGGSVMEAYSSNQTFKENVKPTITTAAFASGSTITVTFSENVTAAGTADYEYYIDGVKQAAVTNTAVAGAKTVTITVPAITDLTKTYQIKYVGTDVKDANLNIADMTGLITVTN